MGNAIEIKDLRKSYGTNEVLKGISFTVGEGECFAFLGTNGAGKTTSLECIESLLNYNSGSIRIMEGAKIGIQLQSSSLPANITAMEAIKLFAKWRKVPVDMNYVKQLGILQFKNRQYEKLSTGQKRRLHLVIAMLGDPDIIFLDEPTAGLDVEGRVALHEEIKRLKQKGKTIVLASHDMAEVEELCDRIAILKDGRLAFTGTAEELTEELGSSTTIRIKTEKGTESIVASSIRDTLAEKLREYAEENIEVLEITTGRISLEECFMDIAQSEEASVQKGGRA